MLIKSRNQSQLCFHLLVKSIDDYMKSRMSLHFVCYPDKCYLRRKLEKRSRFPQIRCNYVLHPHNSHLHSVLCPQVPFLGGACGADRRRDDQDGPHRRQLRREGRRPPEDGGGGQSGRTHPFLRKSPASAVRG